jgi:acetoacetate decarboxylase
VVEHIEKLDYIIVLYKKIQSNSATMGAYYSAEQRERDKASIVLAARERIVKQIPELGGTVFVDRAIPKLMDEMMVLLARASAAYLKTVTGSALDVAMARQQDLGIQEKQLRLVRLHFDILVGHDPRLRGELAKNPLLDIKKYSDVMAKIGESIEEVKKLKKK